MTNGMRRIGVLWSGSHLFEGTAETLKMLRNKGELLSIPSQIISRQLIPQASSLYL